MAGLPPTSPQAWPLPILGPLHQVRPQGVPLHVSADHREMNVLADYREMKILLDGEALVPSLIQRPRASRPMVSVPPSHARGRQPLHIPREVAITLRLGQGARCRPIPSPSWWKRLSL